MLDLDAGSQAVAAKAKEQTVTAGAGVEICAKDSERVERVENVRVFQECITERGLVTRAKHIVPARKVSALADLVFRSCSAASATVWQLCPSRDLSYCHLVNFSQQAT